MMKISEKRQADKQQEEKPLRGQEDFREQSLTRSPETAENQSDPVDSLMDELTLLKVI